MVKIEDLDGKIILDINYMFKLIKETRELRKQISMNDSEALIAKNRLVLIDQILNKLINHGLDGINETIEKIRDKYLMLNALAEKEELKENI